MSDLSLISGYISGKSISQKNGSTVNPDTSPSLNTILPSKTYTGRFAPSPTGPLHFGSLVAATASYLCARNKNGRWLLRIEDVDTQREKQGASKSIITTLEDYGFEWDGDIRFQSQYPNQYETVLDSLSRHTFHCICTRKMLLADAPAGEFGYIYPGCCRELNISNNQENLSDHENNEDLASRHLHKTGKKGGGVLSHTSIRIRTDSESCATQLEFEELCQYKPIVQNLEKEVGDFIVKRKDGLFAYQLAVVVDDQLQGVTDVVRGADLFDNTPRQIYLQCLLGYHRPRYLHFPVAVDAKENKLSKHNLSPQVSTKNKRQNLLKVLDFLGQGPPLAKDFSSIDDLWSWAVQNWDTEKIPKTLTKQITTDEYNSQ